VNEILAWCSATWFHHVHVGMAELDLRLGTLVGGLGAAGGLIYAGRQIQLSRQQQQRDEEWRRTEFARGLIERLSSDDELALCTRALDWGVGPLIIPDKYRIMFEPPRSTFEHNPTSMSEALRADLDANWRSPEALTYRYCFDTLFSYIEAIQHHVAVGNVQIRQLVGLEYYPQLIREPPHLDWCSSRPGAVHPFQPFLDRYYPSLSSFIWHSVDERGAKD
jgi:hypothetical protein